MEKFQNNWWMISDQDVETIKGSLEFLIDQEDSLAWLALFRHMKHTFETGLYVTYDVPADYKGGNILSDKSE